MDWPSSGSLGSGPLPEVHSAKRVCLPKAAFARLPAREREIASIVYAYPGITAKDVEAALPDPMGNSAVRALLRRLVGKGIVRCTRTMEKAFLYSPALALPEVQDRVLERVAEDFFDGSLYLATQRLLTLMGRRDPESLAALSVQLKRARSTSPAADKH
jgi:predicted transcriptional regulator